MHQASIDHLSAPNEVYLAIVIQSWESKDLADDDGAEYPHACNAIAYVNSCMAYPGAGRLKEYQRMITYPGDGKRKFV
jgi:hypothetical protein